MNHQRYFHGSTRFSILANIYRYPIAGLYENCNKQLAENVPHGKLIPPIFPIFPSGDITTRNMEVQPSLGGWKHPSVPSHTLRFHDRLSVASRWKGWDRIIAILGTEQWEIHINEPPQFDLPSNLGGLWMCPTDILTFQSHNLAIRKSGGFLVGSSSILVGGPVSAIP